MARIFTDKTKMLNKKNIVLIGYRGTGKTTIGEVLAKRLGMTLVSADKCITDEMGMSIPEVVERFGWDKFRKVESTIIKRISGFEGCVIDCGGGVVENDNNCRLLKRNGTVILFEAHITDIIERIKGDSFRPPIEEGVSLEEEVKKTLSQRRKKYKKAADYTVNTSKTDIEGVVNEVKTFIEEGVNDV